MAAPSFVPLEKLRHDLAPPVRYAVRAGLEPDPKRRIASAVRIRDVLRAAIDLDAARKKLVEVLATIRQHEAATVAPPSLDLDEPFDAPPPKPQASEPPVEIISLAPDPPSVPPPAPPPMPLPVIKTAPMPFAPVSLPAPVPEGEPAAEPVVAPEPVPAPEVPAAPPPPQPITPVAMEIAVAPESKPLPVVPVSARSRRRRPIYVAVFVVWGLAAIVLTAAAVVTLRSKKTQAASTPTATHAPTPTATPTVTATVTQTVAAVTATTATPMASATATATATATPTATTTGGRGTINLPSSAAGHRVFVDGHVVASDGSKPIEIACGRHNVRVGSHGKTQPVDVPCGGAVDLP